MFLRLKIGLSSSDFVRNDHRSARNIMVIAIVFVFFERITRMAVRGVSQPWNRMVIARMPED
eukprot:6532991-Heterocapsa_arctica.AAC.1